jgi:carbon storage regulator CsrA
MLVLSRRTDEKIVFPSIKAAVQVVSIKPGVVRLGIEAPPDVAVFREEILDPALLLARPPAEEARRQLAHAVRNRLNTATIGLALLRRQLSAGKTGDMANVLDKIDAELAALRVQLDGDTPPAPVPVAPARPRRALVVEDDSNECALLAGFLRMAGLEVATTGDGADALDYLHDREKPDVVVLDMMLPRCDGPTTIRAIRNEPAYRDVKIFAVSGHPQERFGLDRGTGSFDRYFHKPINPEVLLRELDEELTSGR